MNNHFKFIAYAASITGNFLWFVNFHEMSNNPPRYELLLYEPRLWILIPEMILAFAGFFLMVWLLIEEMQKPTLRGSQT